MNLFSVILYFKKQFFLENKAWIIDNFITQVNIPCFKIFFNKKNPFSLYKPFD